MPAFLKILLLCASCVAGIRVLQTSANLANSSARSKTYQVHLLVTRHGLSCANVAEKWISKWDVGRGFIHDTLLSGAGETGSKESAEVVNEWLQNRGLSIDAVLSSVLARSMQTALYMYPRQATPLHVVPYIREKGKGLSNAPKPEAEQPAHLQTAFGDKRLELDYDWVHEFGSNLGEWEEFETFLEQFFLPKLISEKKSGSTIVLPVVTHSNFMRDSLQKCSKAWTDRGEEKPLNNQVVNMVYNFEVKDSKDSDSSDATQPSPAFFVMGSTYEQGRLNGAWDRDPELREGRPQYMKRTDKSCTIQWSVSRKAWRLFIDNVLGKDRVTLFQSDTDSDVLPLEGWRPGEEDGTGGKMKDLFGMSKGVNKAGPVPRFVPHQPNYKLKEAAEVPCDEVSPGLSLKIDGGQQLPHVCDRDVGAQCMHAISNHSWCANCLVTAEAALATAAQEYREARETYLSNERSFKDSSEALHTSAKSSKVESFEVFGVEANVQDADLIALESQLVSKLQSNLNQMGRMQKIMKESSERVTEVSAQTCLSSGHPEPPSVLPM